MRVGLLHACAITASHPQSDSRRRFRWDLLGTSEEAGRTALSCGAHKTEQIYQFRRWWATSDGACRTLRNPGGFRFVDDLLDFDRAVGAERAQRANRGGDRSNDGTNDARGQRELRNRLALLLHDYSTNVSFFNELSKL